MCNLGPGPVKDGTERGGRLFAKLRGGEEALAHTSESVRRWGARFVSELLGTWFQVPAPDTGVGDWRWCDYQLHFDWFFDKFDLFFILLFSHSSWSLIVMCQCRAYIHIIVTEGAPPLNLDKWRVLLFSSKFSVVLNKSRGDNEDAAEFGQCRVLCGFLFPFLNY